jgi:hypothetical protein
MNFQVEGLGFKPQIECSFFRRLIGVYRKKLIGCLSVVDLVTLEIADSNDPSLQVKK